MSHVPTPHPDVLIWWLDPASARLAFELADSLPEGLSECLSDMSTHPFRYNYVLPDDDLQAPYWDDDYVQSHWLFHRVSDVSGFGLTFNRSELPLVLGLPGFVTDTALNLVRTL